MSVKKIAEGTSIPRYQLVMLGAPNAGKTALVKQLHPGYAPEAMDPMMQDSCRARLVVDRHPYMLDVVDNAEHDDYPELCDQLIRQADGILVIYSAASRESFNRVSGYPSMIMGARNRVAVPVVLVGNDCDMISEREVAREEGMELAKRFGCEFVECSARTCVNVQRPFFKIVRLVREMKEREAQIRKAEEEEEEEEGGKERRRKSECRLQ